MTRAVVLVVMLAGAEQAFAQGGCLFVCFGNDEVAASHVLLGAAEGGLVASSIVTALGSTLFHRSGWYGASYALGFANSLVAFGAAMQSISLWSNRNWLHSPPEEVALWVSVAMVHGSLFLWNVIAPSVALHTNGPPPVVAVAIGGRGPTGKRWSGVALQVATF